MSNTYFITAIDTDTGKSIITGMMGRYLRRSQKNVITQKLAQTGCKGISEDIIMHRKLMQMELHELDYKGTTCPYVFPYPASPHLAAELCETSIDIAQIEKASETLQQSFDNVLIEGVGGLMVPLNRHINLLDYLQNKAYKIILVSSGKLGSINHTLMSLDMIKRRGLHLHGLIFNYHKDASDIIVKDSVRVFKAVLENDFPKAAFQIVPQIDLDKPAELDFSEFFNN